MNIKSKTEFNKLSPVKQKQYLAELAKEEKLHKDKLKAIRENKIAIEQYKFILILDNGLNDYLNWIVDERRQHKAEAVRNCIELAMEGDEEYKKFLKEYETKIN